MVTVSNLSSSSLSVSWNYSAKSVKNFPKWFTVEYKAESTKVSYRFNVSGNWSKTIEKLMPGEKYTLCVTSEGGTDRECVQFVTHHKKPTVICPKINKPTGQPSPTTTTQEPSTQQGVSHLFHLNAASIKHDKIDLSWTSPSLETAANVTVVYNPNTDNTYYANRTYYHIHGLNSSTIYTVCIKGKHIQSTECITVQTGSPPENPQWYSGGFDIAVGVLATFIMQTALMLAAFGCYLHFKKRNGDRLRNISRPGPHSNYLVLEEVDTSPTQLPQRPGEDEEL